MVDLNSRYIPNGATPIIGIIARYAWWKGYEYLIPSLVQVRERFPSTFFVFANAFGEDKEKIKILMANSFPKSAYVEIPFEENIFELYHLFDIYVHTPFDSSVEAFGQTYVEALASGIPSVFTLSGVANEFVQHEYNALTVPHKAIEPLRDAIIRLIQDLNLRKKVVENGYESVEPFNLNIFIKKLKDLYFE